MADERPSGEGLITPARLDEMTWALCPVFLASEDCDWPQIVSGPHPQCRKCPSANERGETAGCRVLAEIAARIALAKASSPIVE